jgi:CubicO group peptidase (beta-lactamase class C family)
MKNITGLSVICGKLFIAMAVVAFIAPAQLNAQKAAYFTANGKKINIESFNAQVNQLMKDVGVPGLSLAVINDNRVVYFNTYGYKQLSNKTVVDKETIFEACSLSKSFLVFATHRLVDEGKLDLDKPMYEYLPYPALEHDPRYKLITARMALSHSSGLENWKYENNEDSLDILDEPGKKFIYSGEGYQYLAKVIESIIHKPYSTYIRELVFDPLHLNRTFYQYEQGGAYPTNYAMGHNNFGAEVEKLKNLKPIPASGVHTIAQDFATLIAAVFNKKYLSAGRIRDIMKPVVKLSDVTPLYYGSGFEVIYLKGDTIISHGGNNPGFKNEMFYSVNKKCGLVYLSNGDLGKLMSNRLARLAVNLDVSTIFKDDFYEQYPCYALDLFKTFREKNDTAMLAKLEKLKAKTGGKIGMNTLNQLADMVASGGEMVLAKKLAEENTKLYPGSAQAYYLLGQINMYQKDYRLAYNHLRKAKDLKYNDDPGLDHDIKRLAEMIGEK